MTAFTEGREDANEPSAPGSAAKTPRGVRAPQPGQRAQPPERQRGRGRGRGPPSPGL